MPRLKICWFFQFVHKLMVHCIRCLWKRIKEREQKEEEWFLVMVEMKMQINNCWNSLRKKSIITNNFTPFIFILFMNGNYVDFDLNSRYSVSFSRLSIRFHFNFSSIIFDIYVCILVIQLNATIDFAISLLLLLIFVGVDEIQKCCRHFFFHTIFIL